MDVGTEGGSSNFCSLERNDSKNSSFFLRCPYYFDPIRQSVSYTASSLDGSVLSELTSVIIAADKSEKGKRESYIMALPLTSARFASLLACVRTLSSFNMLCLSRQEDGEVVREVQR